MTEDYHIHVCMAEGGGYAARCQGQVYRGSSPDEALGCAIRELWLNGTLDKSLKLTITYDTEGI